MKKFFALFLALCLLALPVSGCNFQFDLNDVLDSGDVSGDDVDEPGDDTGEPGDTDEPGQTDDGDDSGAGAVKILEGSAFFPQTVDEVMAKFQEFGFEWSSGTADQTSSWSFHFLYEGSEEVNGVPAEVYTTTYTESGVTTIEKHWYNADWECIQVMEDGEIEPWPFVSLTNLIGHYVGFTVSAREVFDDNGSFDSNLYALDDQGSGTQGSPVGSMEVYVLRSLFFTDLDSYGVVEIDGEQYFALIRYGLSDDPVFEQVSVTHLVKK